MGARAVLCRFISGKPLSVVGFFHQIVGRVVVVVFLVEDACDAPPLYLDALPQAFPERFAAQRAVACYCAATAVAHEAYLAVFLQCQGHGAVLAADDVHAVRLLAPVVGIVGKDEAAHGQLGPLEVLKPEEGIAHHLENPEA